MIKDILLMQKRELKEYHNKKYIERNSKITELNKNIIKVVIGPRRAGKSFFIMHELKETDNFGYANFDDETLIELKNYDELIAAMNEIYKKPKTIFLDEIQNLPKWELFVNRLQRQNYNLIITGSNSNLLSQELSTHLTGRHLSTIIFPLSFKEYLSFFGTELTTSEIKQKLVRYLNTGGFPEPLTKDINNREYLKTLYEAVLFKDIVKRHNIRSYKAIEELSTFLLSNTGNPISYKKLTELTTIKSVHTIQKYIKYLEEAFLLFELNAFSYKAREQIKSNKKIYFIDTGFINAKSIKFTPDFGKLYENIVAIHLKKKELEGQLKLHYYKNIQNYEVDFVVQKNTKITELIQTCFDVKNIKTKEREIRALIHASQDLKCKKLTIITEDHEAEEQTEWFGMKNKIRYIPLWKWLLKE
ncbi:MAG: ATP-binding protein [Nanoarchaeota archaeon]|nr:ATP-binding protein [Nanoarchaeota archaeon]MBU1320939.1 ATP-binding protein [Nanoarchaeota archaeon]MBU1597813.1 ATP-binding protein [Nanoarchaeota archaeon]MBU2441672.1 ATP-binding protein [Nanoarchaeota archaeon]